MTALATRIGPRLAASIEPQVDGNRASTAPHRSLRLLRTAAALALTILLWSVDGFGGGTEYLLNGDELEVLLDTRWAGGSSGGYYPLRTRVTNRGPDRQLTLRFAPRDDTELPTVERRINVGQNATVEVHLLVPLVGEGAFGDFEVWDDGELLSALTRSVTLPDREAGPRSALLVIASTAVDTSAFELATTVRALEWIAAREAEHQRGSGRSSVSRMIGLRAGSADIERVSPTLLPTSWLGYSSVDIVAVGQQTVEEMSAANRSALLTWVRTGGTLLVYESSQELDQWLTPGHVPEATEWRDNWGDFRRPLPTHVVDGLRIIEVPDNDQAVRWQESPPPFRTRQLMLGRVIAFGESPFGGTVADWYWLLSCLGPHDGHWIGRNGLNARRGSNEFLRFLIPGVRAVPTVSMLILITAFAVLIGPLNFWFLKRRGLQHLMVLTVPFIAIVTSLSLFAYSTVAHGFSVKTRIRSVTILDQRLQSAVSVSRIALFAGIAPSRGLNFSAETSVAPIWPRSETFPGGSVDWSEAQSLRTGWMRSRTRTQFRTVSHRDLRSRLQVRHTGAGVHVDNGLSWDLSLLFVCDENGRLHVARDIAAGSQDAMQAPQGSDSMALFKLMNANPLEAPPQRNRPGPIALLDPIWRGRVSNRDSAADYDESLVERYLRYRIGQLRRALRTQDQAALPKRSYLAIVASHPEIDLGVDAVTEEASLHVLIGDY